LFKLLYFWDFLYFSKHGKYITGFEYYTLPFGPVPKEFYESIEKDNLPPYLKNEISIIDDKEFEKEDGYKQFKILLKNKRIDLDFFTPYEYELLETVGFIFKESNASQMTEASHFKNLPWDETVKQRGLWKLIDYNLALNKDTELDQVEIEERLSLQKGLYHNAYNS